MPSFCEVTNIRRNHTHTHAILRCFVSRDIALLARAFTVHVRPILDYNCVVWSPHLKHDIDKIEKVQRRYTKRLFGHAKLSYTERLQRLQLCSLELWRLRFDLHMCYRIVFILLNVCVSDFFVLNCTTQTRGHPFKLYKPHSHSSTRTSFFSIRIINVRAFNRLSP